jgi:hypothetical protein
MAIYANSTDRLLICQTLLTYKPTEESIEERSAPFVLSAWREDDLQDRVCR